jgi:hypothetical protein
VLWFAGERKQAPPGIVSSCSPLLAPTQEGRRSRAGSLSGAASVVGAGSLPRGGLPRALVWRGHCPVRLSSRSSRARLDVRHARRSQRFALGVKKVDSVAVGWYGLKVCAFAM